MPTIIKYNNKEFEIELTDEQKKVLGIQKKEDNFFKERRNKENYWTVEDGVRPRLYEEVYDTIDNRNYNYGYYCTSKEKIQILIDINKLFLNLKRFQEYFDDDIINWENYNKFVYSLVYDKTEDKVKVVAIKYIRIPNVVYFINQDICLKAIEVYGEEFKRLAKLM